MILSGHGSDGSAGLGEIRARGGTTFVQDPASAQVPGMPLHARAFAFAFADHCLAPAALGDLLMRTVAAERRVESSARRGASVPFEIRRNPGDGALPR